MARDVGVGVIGMGWMGLVHGRSYRLVADRFPTDGIRARLVICADDLEARGVVIPSWRVFVELPGNFLKAYLGRRHFVRGTYGFLTAM